MAFRQDDLAATHQLIVCSNSLFYPPILGIGPAKVLGSSYIQGPSVFGDPISFPNISGTVMIGPTLNETVKTPPFIPGSLCTGVHPPYSLAVKGSSAFMSVVDTAEDVNVGGNLRAQGEVTSRCGTHILSAKKNFDIPHPSKEGWRLRYTCPESPSNDVYIRGKVINRSEINLPSYWKDFVDFNSITVSLTPIGSHQNVIVKRIDENAVYLQSNGGMPINCFYHIFAERKDGEKLIPEYQGQSPDDYPGNNDEYSISGYHYDTKGN